MEVKINEYYKFEIDNAKGVVVKSNYELKSPAIFMFIYLISIFYNFAQLSDGVNFIPVILYTLPILLGAVYEIYELKQYKRNALDSETIKRILKIGQIRIINILFFMLTAIMMCIQKISPEYFGYFSYVDSMNNLLVIAYFITIIAGAIMFLLGVRLEKRQVIENKRKWFVPGSIVGGSSVFGYFILRNSSYVIFVIFTILIVILLPYAIGKSYFRYKNFDKKVTENDKMFKYKLQFDEQLIK